MSKLPTKPTDTVSLIDTAHERQQLLEPVFRQHLGASLIGDSCRRKLWYVFHGATRPTFPGRILRMFRRGCNEEEIFTDDLRAIGCEVYSIDPDTGRQFTVSACGGHFGGSLDGVVTKLPEAPATAHVVEYKTHSDKSYNELCKDGVEKSKPLHFAQMQCYMHLKEPTRALYLAVNKNDDSLYAERIHYDKEAATRLIQKAQTIIDAPEPLERISEKPDWFECKFCNHYAICHQEALPEVHCRTCAYSTAEPDGTWTCCVNPDSKDVLSYEDQLRGCGDHLYIPALVSFAQMKQFLQDVGGVQYAMEDGRTFVNVPVRHVADNRYSSLELRKLAPSLIGNQDINQLRSQFNGTII